MINGFGSALGSIQRTRTDFPFGVHRLLIASCAIGHQKDIFKSCIACAKPRVWGEWPPWACLPLLFFKELLHMGKRRTQWRRTDFKDVICPDVRRKVIIKSQLSEGISEMRSVESDTFGNLSILVQQQVRTRRLPQPHGVYPNGSSKPVGCGRNHTLL